MAKKKKENDVMQCLKYNHLNVWKSASEMKSVAYYLGIW
jgi:hypothetical protein